MVASVLLVLVFVNSCLTGYLFAEYRKLRDTVTAVAQVQSEFLNGPDCES